jgi:hypothetical protein
MDDLRKTQLWLGGMHVSFVKWTPNALIYARPGSNDTLGHLSRALVSVPIGRKRTSRMSQPIKPQSGRFF